MVLGFGFVFCFSFNLCSHFVSLSLFFFFFFGEFSSFTFNAIPCCCSVSQSCPTLCSPMKYGTTGLPPSPSPGVSSNPCPLSQDAASHLTLCRPLLLLPSVFPSIRVSSSESALPIRWPKYRSFHFNTNPSNEYSGLISLRLTGLISWLSTGLSGVFSSITV